MSELLKVVPFKRVRQSGEPAFVICVVQITHVSEKLRKFFFTLAPITEKSEILFVDCKPKGTYEMDTLYCVFIERAAE